MSAFSTKIRNLHRKTGNPARIGSLGAEINKLDPHVQAWVLDEMQRGVTAAELCRALIVDAYHEDCGQ